MYRLFFFLVNFVAFYVVVAEITSVDPIVSRSLSLLSSRGPSQKAEEKAKKKKVKKASKKEDVVFHCPFVVLFLFRFIVFFD